MSGIFKTINYMGQIKRCCNNCGKEYEADSRNIKRGWGLCCSKSCAAQKREKSRPGYNPERVANNNVRRELRNVKDENEYGVFKGRYTSEGYKIYQNGDTDTAFDEFDDPVYSIENWDYEHPFSGDAF